MIFTPNRIFILFLFFVFFNCSTEPNKDKKAKELRNQVLAFLLFRQTPLSAADAFAKIYYINPLIKATSTINLDYVIPATSANVTAGKKKLVFVHGWDFNDRDNATIPTTQALKNRAINENWADFIKTALFDQIILTKQYDVYAYDYLTSGGIDENGKRFRAKLDELFSNETSTVVIHGHSMGGLVTRFAIYEGLRPVYINRVITTGTPYHGSPWASPQFQNEKGSLGNLASFLTNTSGGKDLAWDNFDNKISGASNSKLTAINAKKDRDSIFYAYHSSITNSGTTDPGAASPGLSLACPVLGINFSPSDCVVPQSSSTLSGNTLGLTRDMGRYDHYDIKLVIPSIQTLFYNDLP